MEIPSILFIDAYDSFTNNIVAQLYSCVPNAQVTVIHVDTDISLAFGLNLADFLQQFHAIVLGPGPGHPSSRKDVGLFQDALSISAAEQIPLLGICLGFQALCLHYSHPIQRMPRPCHGQTKSITTTGDDIFASHPYEQSIQMMNYNSLAIPTTSFVDGVLTRSATPISDCSSNSQTSKPDPEPCDGLRLLAWDDYGYAMAVRHEILPLWGIQFHPESCMSRCGERIISSWWSQAIEYSQARGKSMFSRHAGSEVSRSPSTTSSFNAHIDSIPPNSSINDVAWTMSKFKLFSSQDLASLCYRTAGASSLTMLESTARGRHCIYGFTDPGSAILEYTNGKLVCRKGREVVSEEPLTISEALLVVERTTKRRACKAGCPKIPFWGGWIGFMSYESGLDLLGTRVQDERIVPDFCFVFVERSIVLDQKTGNICIQTIKPKDESWIRQMWSELSNLDRSMKQKVVPQDKRRLAQILADAKFTIPDRTRYESSFSHCNEDLHAGNSYELCLTNEAIIDVDGSYPDTSFQLYQNLNKHNPVPFAAYLHFPSSENSQNGTTIISTSPEQFLSCSRGGTLDMMPMKGTVQRTPSTTYDDVVRILQSTKETAENLMIADLIRHDLYSVIGCNPSSSYKEPGHSSMPIESVNNKTWTLPSEENEDHNPLIGRGIRSAKSSGLSILAINSITAFDTVYQLVSHIRAHPPSRLDTTDLHAVISHNHSALNHVLPPGSMTGAPKKRSCEILQSLEKRNRGVYSGIIGFMDVGGGSSWSVAIRTAWSSESEDYAVDKDVEGEEDTITVKKRKVWHVGAGGAVTVLSDLEGEWNEMMGKMNNVLKGFREIKEEHPKWCSGRDF